jgi:uncharacterized protein YkwD
MIKALYLRRFFILLIFLVLDVILGVYFLVQARKPVPLVLQKAASGLQISLPDFSQQTALYQELHEPNLSSEELLQLANELRVENDVKELEYSPKLELVATKLLAEYKTLGLEIETVNLEPELAKYAKQAGYAYSFISHQVLIGPVTNREVSDVWRSSTEQKDALLYEHYKQVGYATEIITEGERVYGVVVQVLAQKQQTASAVSPKTNVSSAPDISDEEVTAALNGYRATHGLYPLKIDDFLCQYAEKRVGDLVAFGSLDGHAGFTKDFENLDSLPVGIRDYTGGSIGENLAHQYCKNMTTGDSFVAQSGTAIIEWCFDSSTKGHREAQLSKTFRNVCVRHGKQMYVVIFGE